MAVEIRLMRKHDYGGAYSLWQSLPGLGLSGADEETQVHIFLRKNPKSCFVAEENGSIIGTVLGGSDGRRGYIYHLAVDAEYQRMGLGNALVERCLTSLKSMGMQKCHIFVISDNFDGMKFWENAGWLKRQDILVMSKNL